MSDLNNQIERAKELLKSSRHASMATVNQDGTPHNTPFMFLYDKGLRHIYWGSHSASEHSKNILRTGKVFIVVYDAIERGGLYIRAENAHSLEGAELDIALKIHNTTRLSRGQDTLETGYYTGKSPQRMWSAEPVQFWVNDAERDAQGHVRRDIRTEIRGSDLF